MIRFDFTSNGLEINGKQYSFPIPKEELFTLLGEAETFVGPHNEVYIWHTHGLRAFAKEGTMVDTIEVTYKVEDYSSAVKLPFTGQLYLNGETDPMVYYNNHKKERIKLWDSDDTGAFVFNDVTVWYNLRNDEFVSLSLQAFKVEEEEVVDVLPMDEGYEYLKVVWKEWKAAIENKVGVDNKYYNPTHGITQEQLDAVAEQLEEEGVVLPELLVNFYKAANVKWNAVTSAIRLGANGWGYDLLPFENIANEWDEVNGLFDEDEEVDEELIANFDSRLKCTSYANPKWIPIAEGKNGDYLLMDTDPSDTGTYGQIVELQNESWERTVVAMSLEELIYREIAVLEGGDDEGYQFIIENGAF